MGSSSKRARRRQKAQESLEREASHSKQVKRPQPDSDPEEEEDHAILFPPRKRETVVMPSSPGRVLEVPDCGVTIMVKTLNDAIAAVSQDTAQIQRPYHQLCKDNIARDKALADLTAMVREYGSSPAATRPYGSPTPTGGPRLTMQTDVLDEDGNLCAADIGITWADNETFLHGVRVVGQEPVMSTPYPGGRNDDRGPSPMTGRPPSPETLEFSPETIPIARLAGDHPHRPATEARQGYRPAAPIQRFNNKSLNWPAWFRHFRAVADVHREHCNWCPTSTRPP